MIAVDTSTWIAFLEGDGGEDVELLDRALQDRQVLMMPVVLTEVLSDPKLSAEVSQTLSELPLIEVSPGYWQRAGELRAKVLAKRHKARLGDTLIAQSCIDRGIPLLTRPGFPGVCRGCRPRSPDWVRTGLSRSLPAALRASPTSLQWCRPILRMPSGGSKRAARIVDHGRYYRFF